MKRDCSLPSSPLNFCRERGKEVGQRTNEKDSHDFTFDILPPGIMVRINGKRSATNVLDPPRFESSGMILSDPTERRLQS